MQTLIMQKKNHQSNSVNKVGASETKEFRFNQSLSCCFFFWGGGLLFVFVLFFALKTKHLTLEKLPVRKVLFKSFLNIHLAEGRWVRDGILLLRSPCQGPQKKKRKALENKCAVGRDPLQSVRVLVKCRP